MSEAFELGKACNLVSPWLLREAFLGIVIWVRGN